jgi:hypothetical protein
MSNPSSSIEIAIALHGCLDEHVTLYFIPQGQKGIFLSLSGRLKLAGRQPKGGTTMSTRRYSLGDTTRAFVSFSMGDVSHISDNNTCIHLRA